MALNSHFFYFTQRDKTMNNQSIKTLAVSSLLFIAIPTLAQTTTPSTAGQYPINTTQTYPQGVSVTPSDSMASLKASETPNTKAMNRRRERRSRRQANTTSSTTDQNSRMSSGGAINTYDAGTTSMTKPAGKSITDFAASSPTHRTLINALQSADLAEPLRGAGAYTLFAPTDQAFAELPAEVRKNLLEGRNRESLKRLLSYHVASGIMDKAELMRQIKAGNGKARLQTLAGSTLTAQLDGNGQLTLTDDTGNTSSVIGSGQQQANGYVFSIGKVLLLNGIDKTFR